MNTFYIVKQNGFYQLRFSLNHFCISAGHSVEDRLSVAKQWLKKYKDSEGILRVLKGLTYGCKVPPTEVETLKGLISAGETYCTEELSLLEKDCAEFNANNTPLKRTQRVMSKLVRKTPEPLDNRVIEVPNKVFSPVVKKPKLFKRTI